MCCSRTNRSLHNSLKSLSTNNNIKVCRFDKGNGVVLLNTIDYYDKLDSIINDQTKFTEIPFAEKQHPINAKENSTEYYIRKYLKKYDKEIVSEKNKCFLSRLKSTLVSSFDFF